MNQDQEKLRYLLEMYAAKTATAEQTDELFALVNKTADAEMHTVLTDMLEATEPDYDENRRQRLLEKILREAGEGKVVPMYRRNWMRIAAAAVIILLLSV